MEKVRQFISDTHPSQVIERHNLKYEALTILTRSQIKYLKMIHEKGLLSPEAVSSIEEYVKTFPYSIISDDDINDDDDDDDDDGKDDDNDHHNDDDDDE